MALTKATFYGQPEDAEDAEDAPEEAVAVEEHQETAESRGNDVSRELTEVRTVASRAQHAVSRLKIMKTGLWHTSENRDPDIDEMLEVLEQVVQDLRKWSKTGRTKRDRNNGA